MASNKNQHYVPRVYLRPFTMNGDGLAISLINLDRKKLISNAPVKNQCSGDYFYGNDEKLEHAIQQLESGYGKCLRELYANSKQLSEEQKTIFRKFWLFQYLRTENAAIRAVSMTDSLQRVTDIPASEFSLGIKDAVQIACRLFADIMNDIDDLKVCVLKNRTSLPYITSDNPAVITNKWRLDKDRSPGLSFGLGSAGVLAFLPLSPKLMLVIYDGDVYSLPNTNGIAEVKSGRDVIAFNQHQFLQCSANVYIPDSAFADVFIRHYEELFHVRPAKRHVLYYAEEDITVGEHTRYNVVAPEQRSTTKSAIIHVQTTHPCPLIWPSQIRKRVNGYVYTNGTGIGYVRFSRAQLMSTDREFRSERV